MKGRCRQQGEITLTEDTDAATTGPAATSISSMNAGLSNDAYNVFIATEDFALPVTTTEEAA